MISYELLELAFVAAFGLVVGSYLNVVIYRVPRGLSTVTPASRCPFCKAAIRPWQNIPVISYLLLGGRCRECRSRIAWRYPLVEALTSLLFVLCALRFGLTGTAALAAIFCAALVALAGIDLDHMILPDRITLPGLGLALALQAFLPEWIPWSGLAEAFLGAVLGAGLLAGLSGLWYLIRKVEGMGLGDAKMLAMVGAFLGWKGALVTIIVATLAASLVAIALLATGRLRSQYKMPFGPYLSLGAAVSLLFGEALSRWYLASLYLPVP